MRILLVTGKGGVGKTTTAAATALRLADRGVKTLVVSTDAAHSLGDVLGTALDGAPREVCDGLSALQVDTQRRFETAWRDVQSYLLRLLERSGADPVTAEELTVLPGIDEVLALLALSDAAHSGDWDAIVVDCAPTAETLRLLALPEALSWYIERVIPAQRRIARGMRPLAALLGRGEALPPDGVFAALLALHAELAALRSLLSDPATTSVRLVLTPEAVAVAETRRTYTALALYGYAVDGVVVNRVVVDRAVPIGDDPWRTRWAEAQARQLAAVRTSFEDVPIVEVGHRGDEPVGELALREVADELYGALPGTDPAAPAPERPLLQVRPDGEDFVLEVDLPLAAPGAVDATRVGDDLALTVGGRRRVLALPSVLRRCSVGTGQAADGRLTVRFHRDPALWPTEPGS